MRIVLFEFIDEVKALIKEKGKAFLIGPNVKVIGLHPNVLVYLKAQGIPYEDTLRYFHNSAQERISLYSEQFTTELLKDFLLKDERGVHKCYTETCIHHIRLYITHFFWILEILRGITDDHEVKEIYACVPKNVEAMYTHKAFIQDQERFLGLLTKDFCSSRGIAFTGIEISSQLANSIENIFEPIVRFVAELIVSLDYFFLVRGLGQSKIVLVPGLSYNMSTILSDIKKKHIDTKGIMIWEGKPTVKHHIYKVYFTVDNFLKKLKKKNLLDGVIHLDLIKNKFKNDPQAKQKISDQFDQLGQRLDQLSSQATYERVSWLNYLRKKIQLGLREEIIHLHHTSLVVAEVFKQIKPKLLISMYSNSLYCMMGELANTFKFESLNISHGTHVPPNNKVEEIENYRLALNVILNDYKYVAVQTPWTNRFLDYYRDTRPRLVTGPLLYSKVSSTQREIIRREILGNDLGKKIVVHATTQKLRLGFRLHITETLDEYISTLSDIVNAVNENPELYFVLRPHPVCDLSDEDFFSLLPACPRMKIMRKFSFAQVLSATDLMMSYSSTCIEEALQSNIPVVLYDKWKRYNHFNLDETNDLRSLKRNPAYYITDPKILGPGLVQILRYFEKNPLDDSELKDYKYPSESRRVFSNFIDQVIK